MAIEADVGCIKSKTTGNFRDFRYAGDRKGQGRERE